jgi:hypothetical protein
MVAAQEGTEKTRDAADWALDDETAAGKEGGKERAVAWRLGETNQWGLLATCPATTCVDSKTRTIQKTPGNALCAICVFKSETAVSCALLLGILMRMTRCIDCNATGAISQHDAPRCNLPRDAIAKQSMRKALWRIRGTRRHGTDRRFPHSGADMPSTCQVGTKPRPLQQIGRVPRACQAMPFSFRAVQRGGLRVVPAYEPAYGLDGSHHRARASLFQTASRKIFCASFREKHPRAASSS